MHSMPPRMFEPPHRGPYLQLQRNRPNRQKTKFISRDKGGRLNQGGAGVVVFPRADVAWGHGNTTGWGRDLEVRGGGVRDIPAVLGGGGRGIPVARGGVVVLPWPGGVSWYSRGSGRAALSTTTPAPWFSRPPSSLLNLKVGNIDANYQTLESDARLRGRTATQRSKKGSGQGFSEGFWGRVLRWVMRRGPAMGFTVKRVLRRVLRRGSPGGFLERPRRVRPLKSIERGNDQPFSHHHKSTSSKPTRICTAPFE